MRQSANSKAEPTWPLLNPLSDAKRCNAELDAQHTLNGRVPVQLCDPDYLLDEVEVARLHHALIVAQRNPARERQLDLERKR